MRRSIKNFRPNDGWQPFDEEATAGRGGHGR
jgi:hypothetical protein